MTGKFRSCRIIWRLGSGQSALFYFSIVFAFIFGAGISTLLINTGRRRQVHGIYAYSVLTEAILLALLGGADPGFSRLAHTGRRAGSRISHGLQNAVVTRISDARVRTTQVSGMATDIGIELGHCVRYPARA